MGLDPLNSIGIEPYAGAIVARVVDDLAHSIKRGPCMGRLVDTFRGGSRPCRSRARFSLRLDVSTSWEDAVDDVDGEKRASG